MRTVPICWPALPTRATEAAFAGASLGVAQAAELLRAKKILVTHGTGFNWFEPDHFRLVALPDVEVLSEAIGRISEFLATMR